MTLTMPDLTLIHPHDMKVDFTDTLVRVHHGSMAKNLVSPFQLSGFSLCVVICKGKKWQIFLKSKDI